MAHGGARNRSGPAPDPTSGRSDRRQYTLNALPATGFDGVAPAFPLPERSVYFVTYEDKHPVRTFDDAATAQVAERELELWAWAWRSPQACAWSMPSESWRLYTIAMWVRTAVICESSDATAADKNSLHRFADQIGLTTAGLAEMGWKIATEPVAAEAVQQPAPVESVARRLRAV